VKRGDLVQTPILKRRARVIRVYREGGGRLVVVVRFLGSGDVCTVYPETLELV
jgi:hypothetical protein